MNDEMLHWLREIMSKAMPMVSFEANEESMDLGSNVRAPVLRRCVFIPKCKAVPQQFSQDLRQTIESITGDLKGGGVVETYCQDIPEDRNSSEISILSVAFFFQPVLPIPYMVFRKNIANVWINSRKRTPGERILKCIRKAIVHACLI